MKATVVSLGLALALLALQGCQSSLAGTWKLAPNQPHGKVDVAAMTLADDGTFTAQAHYNGRTETMTGTYMVKDGELVFDQNGKKRTYKIEQNGDELIVTHGSTSRKMLRMK